MISCINNLQLLLVENNIISYRNIPELSRSWVRSSNSSHDNLIEESSRRNFLVLIVFPYSLVLNSLIFRKVNWNLWKSLDWNHDIYYSCHIKWKWEMRKRPQLECLYAGSASMHRRVLEFILQDNKNDQIWIIPECDQQLLGILNSVTIEGKEKCNEWNAKILKFISIYYEMEFMMSISLLNAQAWARTIMLWTVK